MISYQEEHAGATPSTQCHTAHAFAGVDYCGKPLEEGGLLQGRLLNQWSMLDLICSHGDICYST